MSDWKKNFDALQVAPRIKELLGLLDAVSTESLGEAELSNFARLQKTLHVLEVRVGALDPELFHRDAWANMNSWLTNLQTYIREFVNSKNLTHLKNANNTVDEILNVVKPLDLVADPDASKALMEAAASFQRRLLDEIESMRGKAKDAENQVSTLVSNVQKLSSEVDLVRNTVEQQKARLDQSIAEFQKQFSQSESARASEFAAATQRFQSEFAAQKSELDGGAKKAEEARAAEWLAFKDQNEKASKGFMKFFQERQKEVNDIFGAIGSASLSGHFARTADADANAANYLRWIALTLMGAMIVVGGISFYQSIKFPDTHWSIFLFRLGTVIVISVPALYAAQESSKHRKREQQNRKLQVELASIDAYLIELPEPKRFEIKEKLTEKFFGQPEPNGVDEPVTRHQLFDLLGDVLKALTKAK